MSAITVTLGGDLSGLRKAMHDAVGVVSASAGKMAKLGGAGMAGIGKGIGSGINFGLKAGIGAALAGGVGFAALLTKAIGKAGDMESYETAFIPLLGGIEQAKKRMAELDEFAKVTPFELPEVVQASRMLEVLTKGALSTSEGLTLVGDAASVAQQPFKDVAMWVGRLYDGLQSGRPVGEAMMRLQEMGLIAGDTRGRIEDLAKAGKKGSVVWDVAKNALLRFSGGMAMQTLTWKGKLSNLADAWGQLLTKLGTPVIDSLKPYLDGLIAKVESMKPAFAALGENIRNSLDTLRAAWDTGQMSELIGTGIVLGVIQGVNEFSAGIRKTMAYLSAAFTEIMKSAKDSWEVANLILIFKNLGRGIADTITAAILKALDSLPGLHLSVDIKRELSSAENHFRSIGNILEDFNGAAAVQGAKDAVARADAAGKKAAATVGNAPLINPDNARTAYEAVYNKLQERVNEQRKSDADLREEMSKKTGAPLKPPDTEDEPKEDEKPRDRLDPLVTSLGKVGGGGYAPAGLLNAQQENNRLTEKSNSLLASLIETVDKFTGLGAAKFA